MKKTLSLSALFLFSGLNIFSQEKAATETTTSAPTQVSTEKPAEEDFDNTWRFGLRVTPQATWFGNADKNISPNGSVFGFGFGLQMEYRFSQTVGLVTGVGGDFEGGKYKSTYDPSNNYEVKYWMNNEGQLLLPSNGTNVSELRKQGNTEYVLNERTINTTYVTIPAILKMSTNELAGFKYFGMFGGEFGIRIRTQSTDTYHKSFKFDASGTPSDAGITEQEAINLHGETPLIPLRIGMNVGIGTEYRLSGKTSFMFSVNYYHSFVNVLKSTSESLVSSIDASNTGYNFVKQGFLMNGIRINLGILF